MARCCSSCRFVRAALAILLAAGGVLPSFAAARPAGNTADAMRLLKANCFSCHNEEKKKGGLVMTARETLLKGGENGAVLVAGKPDQSALLKSLAAEADPHMPPKKQLSAAQRDVLKRWVKDGAKWEPAALVDETPALRTVTPAAPPVSYHPVLAIALSPEGTRLAVGCGSQILLYNVAKTNLTLSSRAAVHPDPVQSLAWSADGARLASGAFRRVVIWNVEPLAPAREITGGLTDRITALRFTPDGRRLVLADGSVAVNGVVRLADPEAGAITASWPAHGDTIFDLALSADGKFLATAGGDKLVKIWELATQKETARIEGHVAQVLSLAFNTNASQLVTAGADKLLQVWDVKTRERVSKLGSHTAAITSVLWTRDNNAVLAANDAGGVSRYTDLKAHAGTESSESASERKLASIEETLYCLAATASGDRVFAGSHSGKLFVWNQSGKLVTTLDVFEAAAKAMTAFIK